MSILKFSFTAVGNTKEEVQEELDKFARELLLTAGGEPWLITTDTMEKFCHSNPVTDPASYGYIGSVTYSFAGPSVLGTKQTNFRDGFRPQDYEEDEPGDTGYDFLR